MDVGDPYELESFVVVGASEASKDGGSSVSGGSRCDGHDIYENTCVDSVRDGDDCV